MHTHANSPAATARVLSVSLIITLLYIAVTAAAGVWAHSLALISEAGHNFSDFLALLLSLVALYLEARPATARKTYGYQRAGVLVAFLNALTLVGLAFYIFFEAAHRLRDPEPVRAGVMMIVAGAGVVMNGVIAAMLYRSSRDMNIRSAFLHMLGDTLSTAAVIAGAWGILATGWNWIDPALSLGIGALILWSSLSILRESLNILLEGTPRGLRLEHLSDAIRGVEGVEDVHDLHVWSLGSETHALSCHIRIADIPPSASDAILREVKKHLGERFRIHHTTIQFEHVVCEIAEGCLPATEASERTHHHTH